MDFNPISIRVVQKESIDPGNLMLELPGDFPTGGRGMLGGFLDIDNPDAEVPGAGCVRLRLLQQMQNVRPDLKPRAGEIKTVRSSNFRELKHSGVKIPRTRQVVCDDGDVIDVTGPKLTHHVGDSNGKASLRLISTTGRQNCAGEKNPLRLTIRFVPGILLPVGHLPRAWDLLL